jgi:phosphoribosylformylglycinamidine cyclo-ligase
MYADGEYDLAGFAVGVVERARLLDGKRARPGDALIGVASSGLHSNGFSLARRVVDAMGLALDRPVPELGEAPLGRALLTPTRIYARAVSALLAALPDGVCGISHITGGGLGGNVPRVLPAGVGARLEMASWERPPIFQLIARGGPVEEAEMRRTFNLGVGLVVVVRKDDTDAALAALRGAGERAWVLGEAVASSEVDEARVTFA